MKICVTFLLAYAYLFDVCIRYFLFFSTSHSLIKTVDRKNPYNEICQVLVFTHYTYAAHLEDTHKEPYKIIVVFSFLCTHTYDNRVDLRRLLRVPIQLGDSVHRMYCVIIVKCSLNIYAKSKWNILNGNRSIGKTKLKTFFCFHFIHVMLRMSYLIFFKIL